jgi:membrane protease YdiL (CAAX protease family)
MAALLLLASVPAALRAAALSPPESPSLRAFGAKYGLGTHRLLRGTGNPAAQQVLESLDGGAETRVDRLRLIPVAAEIDGAQAALGRIESARADAELTHDDIRDLDILERLYAGRGLGADDESRLVERHGWFGELAAVYGRPETDPARRRLIDAATFAAAGFLGTFALAIIGAAAGLALLILAFALRIRSAFPASIGPEAPRRLNDALWIESVAVFFAAWFAGAAAAELLPAIGAGLVLLLPALALGWPFFRGATREEWRLATGLHRGRGVWRETGAGFVGYLAALPAFLLGLLGTMLIASHFKEQPAHPIVEQISKGGLAGLIVAYAAACLWAPLVEETVFRGMLYRYLRGRWRAVAAAPLVGLLFAVVHPQGFAAIPALAALGAMFCLIREWRGSLIASMTAHAIHNFAALTLVLIVMR